MVDNISDFLLLQINDALFPIGGYSHSYGLETYIQKDIVCDEQSAKEFINKRLKYNFLYNEFLAVRLAWEYADNNDLQKILQLDKIMEACKLPMETRLASRKLGSRFIKTLSSLSLSLQSDVFDEYKKLCATKGVHHAVAYGVFCSSAGIPLDSCLKNFIYAQTSAMVTNCVKSIPLSQTSGQKILTQTFDLLNDLTVEVLKLDENMLGLSGAGFDLRCMQHEGLYSRIYMS